MALHSAQSASIPGSTADVGVLPAGSSHYSAHKALARPMPFPGRMVVAVITFACLLAGRGGAEDFGEIPHHHFVLASPFPGANFRSLLEPPLAGVADAQQLLPTKVAAAEPTIDPPLATWSGLRSCTQVRLTRALVS